MMLLKLRADARRSKGARSPGGSRRISGKRYRFWMDDYWDRYIRNQEHFNLVVEYILNNPVKAGLCKMPRTINGTTR